MITINHIFIGFLLSIALPILADFIVGFLRLSSFSPLKNPITFSNSRAVKAIFNETFSGRIERSRSEFIYWIMFNAVNIAAFSISVFYYESAARVLERPYFLAFLIAYTFLSLGMRFFVSLHSASRINFAHHLDKLLFSFMCFLLVFIGLGVSLKSGRFGFGDALMGIAAQPVLYLAFKSFFYCEGRRSRFERAGEAAFRISFNFALYSLYASIAFSTIGKEHLFFGLAISLAVEVLFEILGFETPRSEKQLSGSIERFLIFVLSFSVGFKVFL